MIRPLCRIVIYLLLVLACLLPALRSADPQVTGETTATSREPSMREIRAGLQAIRDDTVASFYYPSYFASGDNKDINVNCHYERVYSTWLDYLKPPSGSYFTVSSLDEFESMTSNDVVRACVAAQDLRTHLLGKTGRPCFGNPIEVYIPNCALHPTPEVPEVPEVPESIAAPKCESATNSLIITAGLAMIVWIGFKIFNRRYPRALQNVFSSLKKTLLTDLKSLYKVASFSLRRLIEQLVTAVSIVRGYVRKMAFTLSQRLPAGPSKVYLNSFDRISFVIKGYGIVTIAKSLATLEVPWQRYNVEALAKLEGPTWYIKEKDSFPDCLSTEVQELLQPHINKAWPPQIAYVSLSVFNRRPGSSRAVPGPTLDIPEDPLLPKRIVAEGNVSVAEDPVGPLEGEPVFHHEEDEPVEVEPAEGVEESVEPVEDEPVEHHEKDRPAEYEQVFDYEAHERAAQKKRISALDPLVEQCRTGFATVKSELFPEESESGPEVALNALDAPEQDPRIPILAQVMDWKNFSQLPEMAENLLYYASFYRPRLLECISHLVATRMDMFRNLEAMDTLEAIVDFYLGEEEKASQVLYLQMTFQTLVGVFDEYEEDPSELGPKFVQILTECIGIGENEPTQESIVEALREQAYKLDYLKRRVEGHSKRVSIARAFGRDLENDNLDDAQDIYTTVRKLIFEAEQIAYRAVLLSYCVNIFAEVDYIHFMDEQRHKRRHESQY